MGLNMDMATLADPGDPLSDWEVLARNGSPVNATTWLTGFIDKLKVNFDTNADFNYAELWQYTPGTFDAHYLTTEPIGVAGTQTPTSVKDRQDVYTFRSTLGGSARLTLMHPVGDVGITAGIPVGTTRVDELAENCVAPSSPLLARDNGYLFAALHYLPGASEFLFKKRLRP